jgi:hypothetical protein
MLPGPTWIVWPPDKTSSAWPLSVITYCRRDAVWIAVLAAGRGSANLRARVGKQIIHAAARGELCFDLLGVRQAVRSGKETRDLDGLDLTRAWPSHSARGDRDKAQQRGANKYRTLRIHDDLSRVFPEGTLARAAVRAHLSSPACGGGAALWRRRGRKPHNSIQNVQQIFVDIFVRYAKDPPSFGAHISVAAAVVKNFGWC